MFNKKTIYVILCIIFLLVLGSPAIACSSFAVYSDSVLYGMNFDQPDVKINYAITDFDDLKVFHMDFEVFGNLTPIVGMNNKGLFAAIQMQYPEQPITDKLKDNQIDMHDFGMSMLMYNSVNDIDNYIKDKVVVNHYLSCHDLFADKTGNAMVVEAGEKNNLISKIQDKFIIMTNFSNYNLKTNSYRDIFEAGSDRYATAYEYITKNKDNFKLANAIEVLKDTAQENATSPTLSSMVFDPENQEIYIVIKRNFEKIWKVSLENKTIEGYKGFKTPIRLKLDDKGILMDTLQKYTMENDAKELETISKATKSDNITTENSKFNYYLVVGVLVFALASIFILRKIFNTRKSV